MLNFFKNLFNQEKDSQNKKSVKTSLQDFFKTDLNLSIDDSFTELPEITNTLGTKIKRVHKFLNYKELDLFDVLEVYLFDNNEKRLFFKNYNLSSVNVYKLQSLINDLYLLNGKDAFGNGTFSSRDVERFNSPDFDVLFGRMWDTPNYKYKVSIHLTRNENLLELVVSP